MLLNTTFRYLFFMTPLKSKIQKVSTLSISFLYFFLTHFLKLTEELKWHTLLPSAPLSTLNPRKEHQGWAYNMENSSGILILFLDAQSGMFH